MAAGYFLFPGMLWLAAAAAGPVIIHLLMRGRPRRVVFPAMRFVLQTHRKHAHKLRLKHLLLMAMRMAILVLAAVLISRLRLPGSLAIEAAARPVAAAIVLDNSASMSYRRGEKTLLEWAQREATRVIEALPPGSQAIVLATDPSAEGEPVAATFLTDRDVLTQAIWNVPPRWSAVTVQSALAAATKAVAEAPQVNKEVYILTDLSATAWAGSFEPRRGEDVRVAVIDCKRSECVNRSLEPPALSNAHVSVAQRVRVDSMLSARHLGGTARAVLELDAQAVREQAVDVASDAPAAVTMEIRPDVPGVRQGRLVLTEPDAFEADNVRYFTLHVGDTTELLIVRDATDETRSDDSTFLTASAVAPPREAGEQDWLRRRTIVTDRLDESSLASADIVLISNVSSLGESRWRMLGRYVREGGRLWVVLGPGIATQSYTSEEALAILPARIGPAVELEAPVAFARPRAGQMLAPFLNDSLAPLSQVRVAWRMDVSDLAPQADTPLRYDDGPPAILSRRIGRGWVVLWNFSPRRGRSNLARLPQWPVLARRTAEVLSSDRRHETMHIVGRPVSLAVPRGAAGAAVSVQGPGDVGWRGLTSPLDGEAVVVRPDRPGHWAVRFELPSHPIELGWSVNVEPAESDFTRVGEDRLDAMLPSGWMSADNVEDVRREALRRSGPLPLTVPVFQALVVLLVSETALSNRFHRKPAQPANQVSSRSR